MQNEKAVTALGIAVGFNRKEVVELLIEKGVDVMQVDGKGNTVLHYAAGE
jgi:ankyrin repeat protein